MHFASIDLRREVLRLPLGLDYTDAELAAEANQLHLVALNEAGEVDAVALLQWVTPGVAKMRQVAVRSEFQGQGLGRQLVEYFEQIARQNGAHEVMLHAREVAVPFYLRTGYSIYDDPFEEVGIPHRKMRKSLL